ALAIPPAAGKAPQLAAYGGSAIAQATKVRGETNAFAGLPAEVNIPFAQGVLESSPAGEATAAVLDTGPLGATVVPSQPQYATALYPGGPTESRGASVDSSDPSGVSHVAAGSAFAKTGEDKSEATSRAAGTSFLPPAGTSVPTVPGGESPNALHTGSSEATIRVEATAEGLVSVAESSAQGVDILGGLIHFDSVHSIARAVSDGKNPKVSGDLSVAGATAGGVPVVIGASGMSVAGNLVPGGPAALKPAQDALNAALAPMQLACQSLAVTQSVTKPPAPGASAAARVVVGGVRCDWTTPSPSEGVPQQHVAVILGAAEAEAHAAPAIPASAEGAPTEETAGVDAGGYSAEPEVSSYIPDVGGDSGAGTAITGSAPRADLGGNLVTHARRKDWLLILVYLAWQVAATAVLISALRKRQAAKAGSR
ncbi:MAG: hypothetical protein WDA71_11405, partial [Actinomycetota bacterium]